MPESVNRKDRVEMIERRSSERSEKPRRMEFPKKAMAHDDMPAFVEYKVPYAVSSSAS